MLAIIVLFDFTVVE